MHSQPKHSVVPQPEHRSRSFSIQKKVATVVTMILILFVWSITWTALALQSIKVGDMARADTEARVAQPFVRFLSLITLHKSASLELWDTSLNLTEQAYSLETSAQTYLKLALQNDPQLGAPASELKSDLKNIDSTFIKIIPLTQKSFVFKKFVEPKLPTTLTAQLKPNSALVHLLPLAETAIDELFAGHHKFVVMLQNSDELRATGGFMGSYAVVDLENGTLMPIEFYDIYDADGQIYSELPAPPGVKEYLSGGQGLRLPNANWNPDFPSSSADILQFLSQAKVSEVDGLIAVNLSLVQQFLEVTGPIQVIDFNQTVTAENLSQVARADRANYFPGSKQKKNFLQSLSTQLRIKFQNLNSTQQKQLASIVFADIQQKNIQFFFHQQPLQQFVQNLNGTGLVTQNFLGIAQKQNSPANYLMVIESNVGINKANKKISREVKVDLQDKMTAIQIHFENQNALTINNPLPVSADIRENPHNDYIDYLRILVPLGTTVSSLTQDGKPVPVRDQDILTTSIGEQFTEIGFLAPVPEQQQSTVIIGLNNVHPFQVNPTLVLQKQSGLPSTFYSVTYGKQTQNFQLDRDKVIQFSP